jgi:hypothetical protein
MNSYEENEMRKVAAKVHTLHEPEPLPLRKTGARQFFVQ